ncbi:MAG: precorrin-6y C5,15-methyltransferase (decarboxylating) subunit CbiE [Proteobacteria bacterium]|nr:precorrin-6y C5,15-methyltransferase (decarboxylating) subunit CbiE [Pseudomonadota bacterium]
MTPWLAIVGLGEDGLPGLAPAARALLDNAEVLIGGTRHLDMVPDDGRERLTWPSPLGAIVEEIARRRGQRVCVLATGDPMHYGIGVTLAKAVPMDEMVIIPAPSAFSLACARLGWILSEVETLTLHGRPLELLHPAVQPGAKLLLLGNGAETPAEVAGLLRARGYGPSRIVVFEHMGGPRERRHEGRAEDWDAQGDAPGIAEFNTVAVDCVAGPGAGLLPRSPGLPDDAFRHDGQMTKREVRAITLAALAPVPGQLLWDVGAGAGSVAIEWLRADPRCRAIAIEREADRIALIAGNAGALGVPGLEIVAGAAPAALDGLAPPDAVFLGGGLRTAGVFEAAWAALKPGGRLVANAVTIEGAAALARWYGEYDGELVRVAISRAGPVGGASVLRPMLPVTQLRLVK